MSAKTDSLPLPLLYKIATGSQHLKTVFHVLRVSALLEHNDEKRFAKSLGRIIRETETYYFDVVWINPQYRPCPGGTPKFQGGGVTLGPQKPAPVPDQEKL